MVSFQTRLSSFAERLEPALAATLATLEPAVASVPPRLLNAMRHGTLAGGKRLRPFLVTETAALFRVGEDRSQLAAIAVEFIHCYSLIHDDLPAMDDDDLRRGRPTVHKAFDEATGVLAGDALLTHAFALLADGRCHPDPAVRTSLVQELVAGAGVAGMIGGQMRDIEAETATQPDEDEILRTSAMKTGALIRASVRIGALLGNAGCSELTVLTRYAERAGLAFQLADDLLDATATAEQLGKGAGKDAGRGKQTIVGRLGVAEARRRLDAVTAEAIAALAQFGPEADGLRDTARFFASREH